MFPQLMGCSTSWAKDMNGPGVPEHNAQLPSLQDSKGCVYACLLHSRASIAKAVRCVTV
jgi:hypothetical protein